MGENFGTRLSVSFPASQVPLKANSIELHPSVTDKWNRPAAYIIKEWHPPDRYLMDVVAEPGARALRFGCDGARTTPARRPGRRVHGRQRQGARRQSHSGWARFGNDERDAW